MDINYKLRRWISLIACLTAISLLSLVVFITTLPIKHPPKSDTAIKLYLSNENRVIKLPLETYIAGVVAAEMPASFHEEALKAQAICARTYTIKKIIERHSYPMGADLSDDITTCQAFISWEDFRERQSQNYIYYRSKIEKAVMATRGEVISYQDKPIDALYHSTCGGATEDASDIWQNEVPYLKSVSCQYCHESKHYESLNVFTYQDFFSINGLSGNNELTLEITDRTPTGRAREIRINNQIVKPAFLRKVLNLPSTFIEFDLSDDQVIIKSQGYGHGVGMCQYGADGMAISGKTYHEIIHYYFTDVDISRLSY